MATAANIWIDETVVTKIINFLLHNYFPSVPYVILILSKLNFQGNLRGISVIYFSRHIRVWEDGIAEYY